MLSTLESGIDHREVEYRATLVRDQRPQEVILLGSTSLIQSPSGETAVAVA